MSLFGEIKKALKSGLKTAAQNIAPIAGGFLAGGPAGAAVAAKGIFAAKVTSNIAKATLPVAQGAPQMIHTPPIAPSLLPSHLETASRGTFASSLARGVRGLESRVGRGAVAARKQFPRLPVMTGPRPGVATAAMGPGGISMDVLKTRALPAAGGGGIRGGGRMALPALFRAGAGAILTRTGKVSGVVLASGARISRKKAVALAKRVGLEAAAVALGITAVEMAQMVMDDAAAGRRRKGITGAQLATAKRVNRTIARMACELGIKAAPKKRVCR